MTERRITVRVWDLPVRLFHWGIVVGVFIAWLTQDIGWLPAHRITGYAIGAALIFRLLWGVVGSDTARFARFLRSPIAGLAHLRRFRRGEPDTEIGHNAAGGWMVLLMLLLLAVQFGTGLFATNDIDFEGPFAGWITLERSDVLTSIHAVNFTAIEIAVLLHVLAVIAYAVVKRHDLVRPMVTGRKRLPASAAPPRLSGIGLAVLVAAFSGGLVAFAATYFKAG